MLKKTHCLEARRQTKSIGVILSLGVILSVLLMNFISAASGEMGFPAVCAFNNVDGFIGWTFLMKQNLYLTNVTIWTSGNGAFLLNSSYDIIASNTSLIEVDPELEYFGSFSPFILLKKGLQYTMVSYNTGGVDLCSHEYDEYPMEGGDLLNFTYGYLYGPSLTGGALRKFGFFNDFIENSKTFNATTYESSQENFTYNFSYNNVDYTFSNAYLVYNNTNYLSIVTGGGNNLLLSNSITIPIVQTTGTNKTFYWKIGLTNSSGTFYFNSTFSNQTINKVPLLIINATCPSGYLPAFNFTFFMEQNLTNANATINYYITYGLSGNPIISINNTITNVHAFSICLNNTQEYYNVGYGELQYEVTGSSDRRYYIFGGTRLTNQTISIPIYSLETADSTQFLVTAQSPSLKPFVNYYIALLRWYPQLNEYKVVEIGKTDDKGQTILNVKTLDVDYKIGVYNSNGVLIKLFNSIRMICQTTPCTYSLVVDLNPLDLTSYTNIQGSLGYNPTTKIFTFTWNDPSQTSQTMNLTIYQMGSLSDIIVCSTTASGYVGTLICDISTYLTGTFKAQVVRTASPVTIFNQLIISMKQRFSDVGGGSLGLFIGAILLIFFALIGTISPVLVVILGLIALVPLFLLGNISWLVLTGFGVIGGVILYFIRRGQ